jgi:PKD repeat protein
MGSPGYFPHTGALEAFASLERAAAPVGSLLDEIVWQLVVVDPGGGDVGQYTSLEIDADDRPHISYYSVTDSALKYAVLSGTVWLSETVDAAGSVGLFTSLALDANGRPHISYNDAGNGTLRYAYYVGIGGDCGVTHPGAWNCQTVDDTDYVGQYTSLALDQAGHPHISYYDATNLDLKYAYFDGTSWNIAIVDGTSDVGSHTSLALDSSGQSHISYYDGTVVNGDLKYAHQVQAGTGNCGQSNDWECTLIETAGLHGLHTSIAVDGAGVLHISYFGQNSIRHAYWVGTGGNCASGTWFCESILGIGNGADYGHTSLALNGAGNPCISYFDFFGDQLEYACLVGEDGDCGVTRPNQWKCEVVDDSGMSGLYNSLAFDEAGQAGISYYDQPGGDLKYALRTMCLPLTGVGVQGPDQLLVDIVGMYTATYQPPTATLPITLTWDNGSVGATAPYSWTTPGRYTLTVTATNPCSVVTATQLVTVCQPVEEVEIQGPAFREIGQFGVYTATYLPLAATPPVTLTWGDGTAGPTAVYSWTTPGLYNLTVTATNPCAEVRATFTVAVALCEEVSTVVVSGPALLVTGETGVYTATYTPPWATPPVTLTWDNGTAGATAAYSWTVPGHYTLTVTATNACSAARGIVPVTVCSPVHNATFDWLPASPLPGQGVAFNGVADGSLPISYTWDVDGLVLAGPTIAYTFTAPGSYPVTMTAGNRCGADTVRRTVTVQRLSALKPYVPLVCKNWNPCHLASGSFWEQEPNEFGGANGPLCSGVVYHGYVTDTNDYFYFHSAPGTVTVHLGNYHAGCSGQLAFYNEQRDLLCYDSSCQMEQECTVVVTQTGTFYARIYTVITLTEPYWLQATFPEP